MIFHGQPDAVVGGNRCGSRQQACYYLKFLHDPRMKSAGGKWPGSVQVHAHLDNIGPKVLGGGDGSFQIVLYPDAQLSSIHGKNVFQIESGFSG